MPSLTVRGMRCEHCRESVSESVSKLPGIASVEVDLKQGKVSWQAADAAVPVTPETVKQAVNGIGFEAE